MFFEKNALDLYHMVRRESKERVLRKHKKYNLLIAKKGKYFFKFLPREEKIEKGTPGNNRNYGRELQLRQTEGKVDGENVTMAQ